MRLVFLGPPGSGKGTEAALVAGRLGLVHISTGEVFRDEMDRGTPLGLQVRRIVDRGDLVPDEVVNRIVFGRIGDLEGFILDGYPRNAAQASALDGFLGEKRRLTGVVHLSVPDTVVEQRLAGRLVCRACGYVGNRSHLGTGDGEAEDPVACPVCGEPLGQREDDRPDRVRRRLALYREKTAPLLDYYAGRTIDVDGVGPVEEVADRIVDGLQRWA